MSIAVASSLAHGVEHARSVATAISAASISVRDGSVTWINPLTLGRDRKPVRLDSHLYRGVAGIALYLAAASRYLDDSSDLADVARRAIAPIRGQFQRLTQDPSRAASLSFSLGCATGLGGYVYALARIGDWLDAEDIVADAYAIARLITPERIAHDDGLDVFGGTAGALLALLALERSTSAFTPPAGPTLIELAVHCGEHLLARHHNDADGSGGWPTTNRSAWCGWGHGVAGISYALSQLALRTRRGDFQDVASRALAFERRHFDATERNWLDLRSEETNFITALCHGAPGIALGRLGMIEAVDDHAIRQEIKDALATTYESEATELDFVCCGNIGRAEVLFEAARRGFGGVYADHAWTLTERTLVRAESNKGRFRWFEDPHAERFSPSFFTGAAGVGYTLLRMTAEETLPCILMLE